jgi:Carbohydrate-selective porin, OprB family
MKNTISWMMNGDRSFGELRSSRQAPFFGLIPLRSISSISATALSILLIDSLTVQPSQAYLPDRSAYSIDQVVAEQANLVSLCAQERDCLPIKNQDLNNQDLAPKELSQTASVPPSSVEVTSNLELAPKQTLDPIAALDSRSLLAIAKTISEDESFTETTLRASAPANDPKTADSVAQELSSKEVAPLLAQTQDDRRELTSPQKTQSASEILGTPSIQLQGVLLNQGDEFSARARMSAIYAISPDALFGAVVDLTTGSDFSDSRVAGLSINELYLAVSPSSLPGLRFVVGQMDLTSYFDRNSFAKDGATHFFNPVFQTNPALSATGIASRPGVLVNWAITDNLEVKAATFSSSRNLGDFAFDAFAGEVALRAGNLILRGTYASDRDAGQGDGFREAFQISRSDGATGTRSGDREAAYGVNGEWFVPSLKLGLFGRYGRYDNLTLGQGGDTYSVGFNFLDLLMPYDRLGLGYGRGLSNDDLRRQGDTKVPDVLELFYDFRISDNLRLGFTVQERNQFSETVVGFRLKTQFDLFNRRR